MRVRRFLHSNAMQTFYVVTRYSMDGANKINLPPNHDSYEKSKDMYSTPPKSATAVQMQVGINSENQYFTRYFLFLVKY